MEKKKSYINFSIFYYTTINKSFTKLRKVKQSAVFSNIDTTTGKQKMTYLVTKYNNYYYELPLENKI